MKTFIRIPELCNILGISPQTLRNMRIRNEIAEPVRLTGLGVKAWPKEYIDEWRNKKSRVFLSTGTGGMDDSAS